MESINARGYGLTHGVYNRLDGFACRVHEPLRVGNRFVKRDIIENVAALAIILVFTLGLAACGSPYVYKKDEFDRESDKFGKEPEDRDFVTICYSHWESTPEHALEIADEECGKFGKKAHFADQRFDSCPLNTPVEATFACTKS